MRRTAVPCKVDIGEKQLAGAAGGSPLTRASSAGSSAGPVVRDRPDSREEGIRCCFSRMKELTRMTRAQALHALTVEPLPSLSESQEALRKVFG